MNEILVGLNTLGAILGYNKFNYYNYDNLDLEKINQCLIMNLKEEVNETPLYNNLKIDDLYTFEGENRYLNINYKTINLIYDKKDNKIKEINYNFNPYQKFQDKMCLYLDGLEESKYAYVDDYYVFNINENKYFDKEIINGIELSNNEVGKYELFLNYGDDTKFIENYFYFDRLNDRHGQNKKGTCAIVAMQILFGYYDTFSNDAIIFENYDKISSENETDISKFKQSSGSGDEFHTYLINFCRSNNISNDGIGMNAKQEKELGEKFLKSMNIDFDYKWVEGNWLDGINNACSKHIKEAIDNNRPIFVGAAGHATVAFAYDEKYVYVHSGCGDVRRTPWATYDTGMLDIANNPHSFDITNIKTTHKHSDNYYSLKTNKTLCPCGKSW